MGPLSSCTRSNPAGPHPPLSMAIASRTAVMPSIIKRAVLPNISPLLFVGRGPAPTG